MGFLRDLRLVFVGVAEFFSFFGQLFSALPVVCQVLIYFGFGGVIFICLLHMVRMK